MHFTTCLVDSVTPCQGLLVDSAATLLSFVHTQNRRRQGPLLALGARVPSRPLSSWQLRSLAGTFSASDIVSLAEFEARGSIKILLDFVRRYIGPVLR